MCVRRVSLIPGQEGGPISQSSVVCSPAVALPPQSYYANSSANTPARFGVSNYVRGLPYKQVNTRDSFMVFSFLFDTCSNCSCIVHLSCSSCGLDFWSRLFFFPQIFAFGVIEVKVLALCTQFTLLLNGKRCYISSHGTETWQ